MNATQTDLALAIDELRLVDTHEHLALTRRLLSAKGPTGDRARYTAWTRSPPQPAEQEWVNDGPDIVQDLFGNYAQIGLRVAGATPAALERAFDPTTGTIESRFAEIRDAWEAMRHTGFGDALSILAGELYDLEELTPEGLRDAQAKLEALQRPGEMARLLRDVARLDHVQIDDLRVACRADASDPELFLYDLSWADLCAGDVDLEALLELTGIEVRTLEDLRSALASLFERFAPHAIAVKSQHAYARTLRWEERSDGEAARAFSAAMRDPGDDAARLVLGDWCWARGVELSIEHHLPFKLHTGVVATAPVEWGRPANLCALLARYPDARFVLMHRSYPYDDELLAIAMMHQNVWVDLCWAWAVNPHGTAEFLRRFLRSVPVNKLFAFGGDTFWPTNAVAYAIQARQWIARALEAEIAAGDLTTKQAIAIARRIMRDNQYACFDISGTRAAARTTSEKQSQHASMP